MVGPWLSLSLLVHQLFHFLKDRSELAAIGLSLVSSVIDMKGDQEFFFPGILWEIAYFE